MIDINNMKTGFQKTRITLKEVNEKLKNDNSEENHNYLIEKRNFLIRELDSYTRQFIILKDVLGPKYLSRALDVK
jgi:hypothetical protein